MVVRLHKNHLDLFRRKARDSKNEIYAFLVGRAVGKNVNVSYFAYPAIEASAPAWVKVDPQTSFEIAEDAVSEGLRVVGTIHSHPNCLPIMSATDLRGHIQDSEIVSGIVEVTNRRTRVAFWTHNTPLTCDLEYI